MPKLRVHNFAISLDGYATGPNQSHDHPLGMGDERLHEWRFAPSAGRQLPATDRGEADLDAPFMAQANRRLGATIMGRNMFGPIRGPWGQSAWTGWWGDTPPYHHPVFVLTHHPHAPRRDRSGRSRATPTTTERAGAIQTPPRSPTR